MFRTVNWLRIIIEIITIIKTITITRIITITINFPGN